MCGGVHTATGSRDASASASKETDLVINVEKTEHVVMSGDQHARQNDSIKTDNKMCTERKKSNKMQRSDVYYQLLSQHVSGIIMPIFRRTKIVCYCIRCTALVLLDVVGSGCGALRCRMRMLASYNRYQPNPAEPAHYTKCSNTQSLFS